MSARAGDHFFRRTIVFTCALVANAPAAPPHYDHVVIVVEENHGYGKIIGSSQAPFINSLASAGVSFTSFYAVAHPSQPNYLHFFSGSAQGITGDGKPRHLPFSAANLGAALLAAGATFTGYSEDLPAAGDATTSTTTDGAHHTLYARKHNPWANWQDATISTPANRLPPATNQAFISFPADFSTLPTVAIVVPNEQNDMHDGTVKMADDWLAAHFTAYATWAATHNSLLIVTWDEDDHSSANRIATVFAGANLVPGENAATWTHHNLLRTLEEMAGTAHAGSAAQVAPITGVFAGETAPTLLSFQQNVNAYTGAHDTQIRKAASASSYGNAGALTVDLDDDIIAPGNQPAQSLIRFDDILGTAVGQIPAGAQILSAKLILATGSSRTDASTGSVELHRMIADWSDTDTWKTLVGGIRADDTEASTAADFTLIPATANGRAIFDVTAAVQQWANGGVNHGWALLPTSANGWRWLSSEFPTASLRPRLEVLFLPP